MPRGVYDRSKAKAKPALVPIQPGALTYGAFNAKGQCVLCQGCHWFEAESAQHGLCVRYPRAVAKRADQRCGEWRGK